MRTLLKALCLVVYALAFAGFAGLLPANLSIAMQTLAVVAIGVHAIEVVLAFRHIRRYPGSLAASVVLTLLFGVLHWLPIARQPELSTEKT